MNKITTLLIITSACTLNAQIQYPQDEPTPQELRNAEISRNLSLLARGSVDFDNYIGDVISQGVAKLTLSVDNMLQTSSALKNLVYSPISIAGALALLLLGSNGKTSEEIASVMGLAVGMDLQSKSQAVHEHMGKLLAKLNRKTDDGEQIKITTAIFVQNDFPIRPLYKAAAESIYNSEILNLDFKHNAQNAQNVINMWVADSTNNKITNILPEVPVDSTKVIIASALYFNGAWEKPFFDGFTRRRSFYPNGRRTETSIHIDMMSNGGQFPYYKDTKMDCEIMGFPYKGNQTTMYVIKPTGSSIDRLNELEARLSASDLERLVANTKYTQSIIAFPKMKLESSIDLRGTLQNLGVQSLFIPGEANLALMSSGSNAPNEDNASGFIRTPIASTAGNSGRDLNSVLILSRAGSQDNCTQIFDPKSNISKCVEIDETTNKQVTYKKFGDKLGRRVTRQAIADSLDNLRTILNRDPNNVNVENPGLYADKVLHKVYIDITESGTEAAAATSVSLSRGGDITTFRVDVPFLFFIRHEETKLILFWGSVHTPTPSFS